MASLLTWVKRLFEKNKGGRGGGSSSVRATAGRSWPLFLLVVALVLTPFFYGMPYTDVALRLGFCCLLGTWILLCQKAPRHNGWRRFYCALLDFFHRLALWLYLCPFLLLPLFYGGLWLAAHYYCFATEALAQEDPWKWLEDLLVPPKRKGPPLLQPGALHQIVIEADGTMYTATADPRAGLDFKIPPGKRAVWVPEDLPNGRRVYHFALWGLDGPEPGDRFYDTHAKKAPPEPVPPRIYHYALWGMDDVREGGRFYWLYRGDRLSPADRFEKQLTATGVTLAQFEQELDKALTSLVQERERIVGLLPRLVTEQGLPPVAPPSLVAPGPLHPDYSRWGWRDWGHHLFVTVLKPVLLTDLSKVQKQPDVGLSWPLLYPSAEWPFLLDVRCTVQEGFSLHLSWRSDSGHWWRVTKDPFFFQLTQAHPIAPQPVYYPPVTQEMLHQRWWDPMTDDERTYVTGVQGLTTFVERELPSWMADLSTQRSSIKTLSQAYDILADIRLKEAELAYRWHFGVIKPATRVLELWFDVQRTQMDIMRLWFCREHTFSRTGCPEWFQSWERQTDARVLYGIMSRYSDSWQFNQRQGHLGRLSFFPFSEQSPYVTEWGTVMRYWDCYDRPPLARDQQQQTWNELLVKVNAGKYHIDKKDVFRNWLGPWI